MPFAIPYGVKRYTGRIVGKISRECFDMQYSEVMSLGCSLINRFDDSSAISLTFDDSPNPDTTDIILRALDRFKVRATFFVVGDYARRHPDLLRAIAAHGHEIGNHTTSHPDLYWVPPSKLRREIVECQEILEKLTGRRPETFRAPYGNFRWDLAQTYKFEGIKSLVKWDVAPRCDETNPEIIASYILERTRPGSIILLHDELVGVPEGLSKAAGEAAAECLNIVIPRLLERNLHFKTISEQIRRSHAVAIEHESEEGRFTDLVPAYCGV